MKQIGNSTANTENTIALRSELFALITPVRKKISLTRIFEIALLVMLYATFLVSISLIVLMNECVISPDTAFYTLLPLAGVSLLLLLRVLFIRH